MRVESTIISCKDSGQNLIKGRKTGSQKALEMRDETDPLNWLGRL